MKNFNFLFTLLLFSTSSILAQSAYEGATRGKIGSFEIKKVDFSFGYETDYINGMDAQFFLGQMADVQQARLDEFDFVPLDITTMSCENPSLNLGVTLEHPRLKNVEWRNAFSYKPNRVDAITYWNRSSYDGNYININSTHAEYALESALVYRLPVFAGLNLYGGIGTNLGLTSNNHTCVFTSLDLTADDISFRNVNEISNQVPAGIYGSGDGYSDCFNTGTQLNQRIFLQTGFGLVFLRRIEIGLDVKYGYGYRADFGNSINGTNIVSTNVNIRYLLK